jgi:hypothetical protein
MPGKKIGILTLPIKNNYGGIIQLVALYHFLESKGFHPVWIEKNQWYSPIKGNVIKLLEKNPLYKIYDPKDFAKIDSLHKQIRPFLKRHLANRTRPINNEIQLKEATNDIDAFVVGSDQVWRLEYVKDNYPTYFLDFVAQGKMKIAYAASFGKDYWEGAEESIQHISKLLKEFDLVTVREDKGVEVCKNTFGYPNAHHVLDPTFLPEVSFYEKLITSINLDKKIELFNYVLDPTPNSAQLVEKISAQKNLKINKIYLNESKANRTQSALVENWLAHFYHADFVVTDSFHGMVFSIIFNKPFIVFGNKERGLTRFTSLLKLLDLEERLINVNDATDIEQLLNKPIDYTSVNKKLNEWRVRSANLLLEKL